MLPRAYSEEVVCSSAGTVLTLAGDAAHHLRVRRVQPGADIGITDGQGGVAEGRLEALDRHSAKVAVRRSELVEREPAIHLLAPVGDRDRMLWLAEKATELQLTSWHPVFWGRSRSVTPRGEGEGFRAKLRARMVSAMLQSGGAWLPEIHPEMEAEAALDAQMGYRILLHPDGAPLGRAPVEHPVSIALGPEGGFESSEVELAHSLGWERAALGRSILRFETAGVVALGMLRGR